MKKIMLIGFGGMAHEVMARLPQGVSIGWIVAREGHHAAIADINGGAVKALLHPSECSERPDLVLECASQQAVREYAETVLNRGWDLAIASTGALADAQLLETLRSAARAHRATLTILSGAVAGMDGLAAAREGGLESVTYVSNKSPASWCGSPAEKMVDLDNVTEATVFLKARRARLRGRFLPMRMWPRRLL